MSLSQEARALHSRAHVIDLHADTLIPMRFGYDLLARHENRLPRSPFFWHVDLPRLFDGGVTAQYFGLVAAPYPEVGPLASTHGQIELMSEAIRRAEGKLRLALTAEAVRACKRDGVVGALYGIEGAHALEGDLRNLEPLAERGARYLGLSHFTSNGFAPCSKGVGADNDAPLPAVGHALVEACEAHGVLVDLAHLGRRAFLDVASRATKPVIVSHTGVRGGYDHWRNLDDQQLRAVADRGGVVGIIFASVYLGKSSAPLEQLFRHIDHVRRVVGIAHVALGSDYDGSIVPIQGLEDISKLGAITELLLARGYSDKDVLALLGENVLRVMADAPPHAYLAYLRATSSLSTAASAASSAPPT